MRAAATIIGQRPQTPLARIMQECGLQAQHKAKRRTTTDSTHNFPHYANLVAELEIVHPEHIWMSDITYIRLGEGFVYQVVLMDVFTVGFVAGIWDTFSIRYSRYWL